MALQFGTQIALARMLGPDSYGVFAIGAVVIGFSGFFSDVGIAYGLIQKREVTDRDVRFVFTWQCILGLSVTVAVALGAGKIAAFFGETRAELVVLALAPLCFVNALSAPAMNLLKRALDFRTLQLSFLISYLVGYVLVGIPLALAGLQVWALVLAWSVQATLNGWLLYRASRHSLTPLIWYEQARQQGMYGLTVLATNLLNWVIASIDRVIIGRLLPARSVGLYATSYNLVFMPTSSLMSAIQPVFFSASARLAEGKTATEIDAASLQRGLLSLVGAVSLFVLPAFCVLSVLSHPFVLALYGKAWVDASALLRPLALAMPFYLVWGMTTPVLWASGNASREFRTQWPLAICWVLGCWQAVEHFGAQGAAWGLLVLFATRCIIMLVTVMGLLHLRAAALLRCVAGGVAMAALLSLVAAIAQAALLRAPPLVGLLAVGVLCLAMGMLALRLVPAFICPELGSLLARVIQRLPPALALRLGFLRGREART